jgi:TRAP-type C4-dicarboxylate transport system permease small subunit
MRFFRDPRVTRVLRPLITVLGLLAAAWHATHTWSAWQQSKQWETSDPPLSNFFWASFQSELGVTIAAFFAGVVAWHLFKPRAPSA